MQLQNVWYTGFSYYQYDKSNSDTTKSYHSTDHDQLRPQLWMNFEHVQNTEAKQCEYNSRRIETLATGRSWNKPKYKTYNICDERNYVNTIPQIIEVADKLESVC